MNAFSTIVTSEVDHSKKRLNSVRMRLDESMHIVNQLPTPEEVRLLADSVLSHYQAMLIRELQELLDDCYLQLLLEVLQGQNLDHLSLQKSKTQVDLSNLEPLEDGDGTPEPRGDWLNLSGLVTDIWNGYKFEPFERKTSMLLKPIGFEWPHKMRWEILKHVTLRNCIQHHGGNLNGELLDKYLRHSGLQELQILATPKNVSLKKWKPVVFTIEELRALNDLLLQFANQIESAVGHRMPKTKQYRLAK